jgi:hypothetical protein
VRLRRTISALILTMAGLAAWSAPAFADVTGLQVLSATSALNSSDKSATRFCPAEKRVIGAAAHVVGGSGQVVLKAIVPVAGLGSATATAAEDQDGYAGDWSVTVHALCAVAPPGLERVSATSAGTSTNKSATASCPAGKRVLGTGGEIAAAGGEVALDDILPNGPLSSVGVQGSEDEDGTPAAWTVTAYAICGAAVAGLERQLGESPTDSEPAKTASAHCSPGKQVIGAGAQLVDGSGRLLSAIAVFGSEVNARGIEDEDGTATDWQVRAFAICAGTALRRAETTEASSFAKSLFAPGCAVGKRSIGGGGQIDGGQGQTRIQVGSGGFAHGSEDETGTQDSWSLTTYRICATTPTGTIEEAVSPQNSSSKGVTVTCPTGTKVLTAHAVTVKEPGVLLGEQLMIDDSTPHPALDRVTATAFEDETGTTQSWRVRAWTICGPPPPGLERVVVSSAQSSTSERTATAFCPAGKYLLGTGADIGNGLGEVSLQDVRVDSLLRNVHVVAHEDETGTTRQWFVRAYAICADM